ncbi:hypothetical protein Cadr_000011218 [Camelus dromedarius]|uniref:Uncharacterized protein n=1 Tax=Camelus dromedarius TaxID=9838 RepID=A0A5N4DS39_CAMDR|nr:hypothetical protein Cadr_000011218 [Camelus dromedarius]
MGPGALDMGDGFGPGRPIPREPGPEFGPMGPGILAMEDGLRPLGLVSRLAPGPGPPALGLGPTPGPKPLALGLGPRLGPGNIPDLGAGFVPTKPDLRLGPDVGPKPTGLGLGGPFPGVNRTLALRLGPDPGPMGPPLLESGPVPRRPPALALDIGLGPGRPPNLGLDRGPGPGRDPALAGHLALGKKLHLCQWDSSPLEKPCLGHEHQQGKVLDLKPMSLMKLEKEMGNCRAVLEVAVEHESKELAAL